MNKKHNFFMVVVLLMSPLVSFASEANDLGVTYQNIANAYNQGEKYLQQLYGKNEIAKAIVDGHRAKLRSERSSMGDSSRPALLKFVATMMMGASIFGIGALMVGAVSSYGILSQPKNGLGPMMPGMSFVDALKLNYGLDTSWSTMAKKEITERYLVPHLSREQNLALVVGKQAPALALGSFVIAGISRYLFNKAYKIKQLDEEYSAPLCQDQF